MNFSVIQDSTSKVLDQFTNLESAVDFANKTFINEGNVLSVCQLDSDADGDGSRAWSVIKRISFVKL